MGSLPSSAPPLPRLVWVSFWEGGGVSKFSVSARDCRALSEMSGISGSCFSCLASLCSVLYNKAFCQLPKLLSSEWTSPQCKWV